MSEIRFHTPEDVEIAFQPAGPGTRYIAVFIDQVIITIAMIIMVIGLLMLGSGLAPFFRRLEHSVEGSGPQAVVWIALAVIFLLKFAVDTFYYILFEIIMNGQTPGKKYMRIQVIQDGGYPLTPASSFLRNIMRIVDNLPVCWPVLLFSAQHKRIGDYVAGTVVVSKRPAPSAARRARGPLYRELGPHQFEFTAAHLAKLGQDDLELIESYFERSRTLRPVVAGRLRRRICAALCKRLGMPVPTAPGDERRFLEELGAFLREQTLKRQI